MRCEDVTEILRSKEPADTLRHRAARAHADRCPECSAAERALTALLEERFAGVPAMPPQSFARALERAAHAPQAETRRERSFWLGTVVGGAIAAGVALAIVAFWPEPAAAPLSNPVVRLALNETREVSVALESPEALTGAEIHVLLTGGVELQGFSGQRELRWMTDLDRGVNQLTLPLIGRDTTGGQVTVEVQHGAKVRTFVIDIQPVSRPTAALDEAAWGAPVQPKSPSTV